MKRLLSGAKNWFIKRTRTLGYFFLLLVLIVALLFVVVGRDWAVSWDLWTVLTAVGTVGATVVAVILALRSWIQEKNATARLVSAWVSDEYQASADGSSYKRVSILHIANESNEPVFNAMVNVHIGTAEISLGPLAVPAPISVIPPRRELVFDISIPLLAHTNSWNPRATLTFDDPKGKSWLRKLNGELQSLQGQEMRWSKKPKAGDMRQLGNMESLFNPMTSVFSFLRALRSEPIDVEILRFWLASEAPGWEKTDWQKLGQKMEAYNPTSMVDYPAPRIARVKLSGDKSLEGKTVEGEGRNIRLDNLLFVTLTLHPELGWRIFAIGENVSPDTIYFDGSLAQEVRPDVVY